LFAEPPDYHEKKLPARIGKGRRQKHGWWIRYVVKSSQSYGIPYGIVLEMLFTFHKFVLQTKFVGGTAMKRRKVSEKMFQFWLSEKEMEEFNMAYAKTPYRSKGEYSRKMLLGKPITVYHRNKSLDELIELVIKLRKDLKSLPMAATITADEREHLLLNVYQIIEQLIKIIDQCSQK
jgi:hypothetical protein